MYNGWMRHACLLLLVGGLGALGCGDDKKMGAGGTGGGGAGGSGGGGAVADGGAPDAARSDGPGARDASAADAARRDGPRADGGPRPDAPRAADAAPRPDAPPADFSCSGMMPSTMAVDPLRLSGQVIDPIQNMRTGIPGATVEAWKHGGMAALATTTADAMGAFSLDIVTMGMPFSGYVRATKTGFVESRFVGPLPLTQSFPGQTIALWEPGQLGLVHSLVSAPPPDATGADMIIAVVDCRGEGVAGVSVQLTPAAGALGYLNDAMLPDTTQTQTGSSGLVFVFNARAGMVHLTATGGPGALRPADLQVPAGVFVTTALVP